MAFSITKQFKNSYKHDIYENTKFSINECLKQFNEFTNCLNEVCNQASLLGRSLQSLDDIVIPEVIGATQTKLLNRSKRFESSAYLMDALDAFSKIMMSYSERIKNEAIDSFDNFIVQAILPNPDEIKGIQEHNSQIICELREAFFSLYNHFLILAAELMEKFLICNNCSTPIGFPHQPLCFTESISKPNIWRKTKYDDKFITFGMHFRFEEITIPECRKDILLHIENACSKQSQFQCREKTSFPLTTRNWPCHWFRGNKDKSKSNATSKPIIQAKIYCHPTRLPLLKSTVWSPTSVETRSKVTSNQFESFTYRHDQSN